MCVRACVHVCVCVRVCVRVCNFKLFVIKCTVLLHTVTVTGKHFVSTGIIMMYI